jgi:hypothetical protein
VPATGQIYPVNDHGYYFYVSRTQSILLDSLLSFAFPLFFFLAAILGAHWKVIPMLGNKPKKFY